MRHPPRRVVFRLANGGFSRKIENHAAAVAPRSSADTTEVLESRAVAKKVLSSFAEMLPRIYELKDMTDQSHSDAYFRNFENRFAEGRTVLACYERLERQLSALDDEAWGDLKSRAAPVAHIRGSGRGWQTLFDTLNEAKGYVYLRGIGCTGIEFIKRSNRKTPDLGAFRDGTRVLCEVKTINVSQDEAARRAEIAQGASVVHETSAEVRAEMLKKVSSTLQDGIDQLDCEDPQRVARRIVFTVLNFDDWVGDYQPEYIAQLDAHLLANPVVGAELVFCAASNLFERRFAMRSASVVEI